MLSWQVVEAKSTNIKGVYVFLAVALNETEIFIGQLTGLLILVGLIYRPFSKAITALDKLSDATKAVHEQLIPATGEGLKTIVKGLQDHQTQSLRHQEAQTRAIADLSRLLAAQGELHDEKITEIWKTLARHDIDRRSSPKED